MPVPRKAIEAFVNKVIRPFQEEVKGLETGSAFQVVKSKTDPESLKFSNRIPHIIDMETGNRWIGRPGQYHQDLLTEKQITVKPEKMIFVEETPNAIEFRQPITKPSEEHRNKAIEILQGRFPDKPIIHPDTGKVYGVVPLDIQSIVGDFEEEKKPDDIESIIGGFEPEEKSVTETGKFYKPEDLYKFEETGIRRRKTPEEFIKELESEHIEPEYAIDLYNSLQFEEQQETDKPLSAKLLETAPLWKGSGLWSLDLLNIAGYGITGSLLGKLPRLYKPKASPEMTEKLVNQQLKAEGKDISKLSREDKIELEFQRNYDPDPNASLQFDNLTKVNKMKQIEGLEESDIAQVIRHEYEPTAPKITKEPELITPVKQLGKISPAHQVAQESLSRELVDKNIDELIHDLEQSGFYITWDKMKGTFRKAVVSSIKAIRTGGVVGDEIAGRIMKYVDIPEVRTSQVMAKINAVVRSLNSKETVNLVDYLDAQYYFDDSVKLLNDKVKNAAKIIAEESGKITDEARNLGQDVAQQTRPFWTHFLLDQTKLAKSKPELLKHLVQTKQAKDVKEAMTILEDYARKYADQQFAGLEGTRTLHIRGYENLKKFGFDVNPVTAWENYFLSSFRRVESIKQFGEKGYKTFYHLTDQLAKEDKVAAQIAAKLYKRLTHRDEKDIHARWIAKKLVNWNIITLMGMSQIMQFGSIPNIFIRAGFKNGLIGTYKGLASLFNKADKEFADDVGAIFNSTINDFRQLYGASKWSEGYLKIVGMTKADELTRIMAAHAGKKYLDKFVKQVIANPNNKRLSREAERLFINVKDLVKNKVLNPEQEKEIIKRFVDTTIGRARPTDLPLWWSSPLAKVVTLFKNFLYFQTKFMKDHVFKEIAHGNLRPILPVALIQYPTGYLIGEARAKWKDTKRPKGIMQFLDNIAMVQGLGIFLDLGLAASKNVERTRQYIAGPVISDLGNMIYHGTQATLNLAQGKTAYKDWKAIKKYIYQKTIKAIPFIGPILYTNEFPETKKGITGRR